MTVEWLPSIGDISGLVTGIGKLIKSKRATKDLILRELRLNIKAFQTAKKSDTINYDGLLDLLKNEQIKKARASNFSFNVIKRGKLKKSHVRDSRNFKYIGKDCNWLFKNIDEKIEDLQNQRTYFKSLHKAKKSNIGLQFSNLFYKLKLLAEFISS